MTKQTGLGRGLSALMGENRTLAPSPAMGVPLQDKSLLPLQLLTPGNFQPRRVFSEEHLRDLAESIQKNGVILPIIVRPSKTTGQYEIIAGERRWRASKMAGLTVIPAVIRNLNDREALEFALIENIQRQDLTPLEEADGYLKLLEDFAYTQEELASRLGKSRSHITNLLRLLTLPSPVKDFLHNGTLAMGHARALVNVENAVAIAEKVVKEGLSVRQVEKLVQGSAPKSRKAAPSIPAIAEDAVESDNDIAQIAGALSQNLGMAVSIEEYNNTGKLTINFTNLSQLDKVLQLLGGKI